MVATSELWHDCYSGDCKFSKRIMDQEPIPYVTHLVLVVMLVILLVAEILFKKA